MKFDRRQLLLYAVTDDREKDICKLLNDIEEAISGGVTMVQLRDKNSDGLLERAILVRKLCHSKGIPLIINDDPFVAQKSGADGVHVGRDDMPVLKIRESMGRDIIVGATAKTIAQAQDAERDGADYIGVGAVFASKTKENAKRITVDDLRNICESVSIPAVAIGGINASNALELNNTGIAGIAAVASIFAADDKRLAAEELKKIAESVVKL